MLRESLSRDKNAQLRQVELRGADRLDIEFNPRKIELFQLFVVHGLIVDIVILIAVLLLGWLGFRLVF